VKIFKDFGESTKETWEIELQAGYNNFNHENVLKMIGAGKNFIITKAKQSKKEYYFTVTEICQNGDFFDFILDSDGVPDSIGRQLFLQVI